VAAIGLWVVVIDYHESQQLRSTLVKDVKKVTSNEETAWEMIEDGLKDPLVSSVRIFKPRRVTSG
jgi:hypothetical protein